MTASRTGFSPPPFQFFLVEDMDGDEFVGWKGKGKREVKEGFLALKSKRMPQGADGGFETKQEEPTPLSSYLAIPYFSHVQLHSNCLNPMPSWTFSTSNKRSDEKEARALSNK